MVSKKKNILLKSRRRTKNAQLAKLNVIVCTKKKDEALVVARNWKG